MGVNSSVSAFDTKAIEDAVSQLLRAVGVDPGREGLIGTPHRIAEMYQEILQGMYQDPREVLAVGFEENHQEMVIVRDIPFYSMCEHHLLPFHGMAHFGYLPDGKIIGLSKVARLVECLSRRPQVQERLAGQIVDTFCEKLHPLGCGVVIEAEHLCMTMRGVKKPGSKMVTSALRGVFRDLPETRAEFLAVVRAQRN